MSEELNIQLKRAYYTWKDESNPPIPIETIRKYLELEGIFLDNEINKKEILNGK